ncbi:hypothetical protein [Actinoplanes sp. NPDC023714]|uniref:hypothetical protein n=1 Tax=Actinoplanes sp. NPDC023714 TaxID=3154322 RepID=UPI0033FEAEE9
MTDPDATPAARQGPATPEEPPSNGRPTSRGGGRASRSGGRASRGGGRASRGGGGTASHDGGTGSHDGGAEARADRLKERVYITFAALAVVLALREHHTSAARAGSTLIIAVGGTLLAVLVADVVSHIAVHQVMPTRPQLRHMIGVVTGALGALVLPFVFLALAYAEVWTTEQALRRSTIALVAWLVAIGWAAVRRVRLPVWQKMIVLFAEFALGAAVVALEWLAHGA